MYTFKTARSYNQIGTGMGRTSPGWYQATVTEATEEMSRNGTPQIKLVLEAQVGASRKLTLRYWLPLITSCEWKIEQFLAATGKQFGKGEEIVVTARELEGKKLVVTLYNKVIMREGKPELYPDILDCRKVGDVPHVGAMTPEELEEHGLRPDGTRMGVNEVLARDEQRDRRMEENNRREEGAHAARVTTSEMAEDDIPF